MLSLIRAFMVDTSRYGDAIEQVAADRARYAARADIRRSHERTFSPQGPTAGPPPSSLPGIDHQVLPLHGREDRIIPWPPRTTLRSTCPTPNLHVLPNTGHWVQIEQADRFVARGPVPRRGHLGGACRAGPRSMIDVFGSVQLGYLVVESNRLSDWRR